MRLNKWKLIVVIVIIGAGAALFFMKTRNGKETGEVITEIQPFRGSIETIISTTGTVLPKNRLEVKPPVNGRVEKVLVQEGEKVKAGQILAWMSSTERAALLDAARGQGEGTMKYWEEVYKPIPLLSPLDGEVIVATTQPAQTVTTADAVVVLSDHLIVRAQVDETDIGKIFTGQDAVINLDAYPETKIKSKVEHIYYESQTVNNVTIYNVDLVPEDVPGFFRSGMNATVDFKEKSKDDALLIPVEALHEDAKEKYVLLKNGNPKEPKKQAITTGITDDKNIEVLSGLTEKDTVIVKTKKFMLPKSNGGTNPFMPSRRKTTSK